MLLLPGYKQGGADRGSRLLVHDVDLVEARDAELRHDAVLHLGG